MNGVMQMPVRSRAEIFLQQVGHISPVVLRLGTAQERGLAVYELERLIATDPQFALRVLSLANSAFYSQRYRIDSLRSALVVLGTDIVCRLAEGILARNLVGDEREEQETFWLHCLAVGVGARLLAETDQQIDPEQAFVAGLLHDIGLLANDIESMESADARYDDDHAALGAEIAQLLDIPHHLCSAIHAHHDEAISLLREKTLEDAVFKANILADYCGYPNTRHTVSVAMGPGRESGNPAELSEFGFVSDDVATLSARLHEQVEEIVAMIEHSSPGRA